MAEALWALGSASALRAWVGLSRPEGSLDGINERIKIFLLKEREKMAVPASRQAPLTNSWKLSSYGARLTAGLVKMERTPSCSESKARSCFPEVAPKQLVGLRRRFVVFRIRFTSLRGDAAEFRTHPFSSDLLPFSLLLVVIWPVTMGVRSVG